MKKLITAFALLFVLIAGTCAFAEGDIEVYVDGEKLAGVPPLNVDGRVLVPMRAVFEALGADVRWDGETRSVYAEREDGFTELTIDDPLLRTGVFNSDGAAVEVDSITLDVPAKIINDYTYVPVRAVSEALGASVHWNGADNSVTVVTAKNIDKPVYYSSVSDYGRLYAATPKGETVKLSSSPVKNLEMCEGYVYYVAEDSGFLYRASVEDGEELILDKSVDKVAVDGGYVYYRETDSQVLYRIDTKTREVRRLTDNPVQYPRLYRGRLYFNLENDNKLYALTLDGASLSVIDIGDSAYTKLYPFNCVFFGDYILIENGMWYGNIMRVNLDGTDIRTLTNRNSILFKDQEFSDKIVYVSPDAGQDIYCVNLDGADDRLVHKGDASWLDIEIVARDGETVYYKHPMRMEVYRVNLDGSGDSYVCYADNIALGADKLAASYNGVYIANKDGSGEAEIYDRDADGLSVRDSKIFFTDRASKRLYSSDFDGNVSAVTGGSVGEWVY